jgi:GTPase SAR1 family protein
MPQPESISDVVKQRKHKNFIGRKDQLKDFDENLKLPFDHPDRRYIINIIGQGGVGKTWLGNECIERMRLENYVIASMDISASSVLDVLDHWASQIEKSLIEMPRFRGSFKVLQNRKNELGSDKDAPEDILNVISSTLVRTAFTLAKNTPAGPITSLLDQEKLETGLSKGVSFLYKKVTNKEERELLLQPIPILTGLFLEDLGNVAKINPIGLRVDVYEQNCTVLDEWLRKIYSGEYGDVPLKFLLIISGRDELDSNTWSEFQPIILTFNLEPFSEEDSRDYLQQKKVTDEKDIELILKLSMGLPLLLELLAIPGISSTGDTVGANETAISRFLQWINDPSFRELALNASLPRFIDQDVIGQITGKELSSELFERLRKMPFIEIKNNQWVYHDLVRELMLVHRRQLSLERWKEVHGKLAGFYELKRDSLGLETIVGMGNSEWQKFAVEAAYHRFCQSPTMHYPKLLNELAYSLSTYKLRFIIVKNAIPSGKRLWVGINK